MQLLSRKNTLPFLLLIFLASTGHSQIPTGSFQTHFNYQNAVGVTLEDNFVYCHTINGFFRYDKQRASTQLLDKRNGLTEMNISATAFKSEEKQLIIGYKNGTIDFVNLTASGDFGEVSTIDFIKNATGIQQDKRINKLFISGKRLFTATNFGLVEIDLTRKEVTETYRNIGPQGISVSVNDIQVRNDSIFLKTSVGILGGSLSPNINLLFFGNWKLLAADQFLENEFPLPINPLITNPKEVKQDQNGIIWIADGKNGLVSNFSGKFESLSPQGLPETNGFFFKTGENVEFSGQRNYAFSENKWTQTTGSNPVKNPKIKDSFGNEWQLTGNSVSVTNNGRSASFNQFNGLSGQPTDIALDRENQFWVTTTNGVTVIPSTPDLPANLTQPYTPIFGIQRLLLQQVVNSVVIDGGNRKWFGTNNGLFGFNATTDELPYFFDSQNSLLPEDQVLDIEIDQNGELFILTPSGVVSYQTDASEPAVSLQEIVIYPNPVKVVLHNVITIKGLSENTSIRIVGQDGRVVNATTSNGGTASWNLQLSDGSPAASGIYFVMAVSRDLTEQIVGRFAVIR